MTLVHQARCSGEEEKRQDEEKRPIARGRTLVGWAQTVLTINALEKGFL